MERFFAEHLPFWKELTKEQQELLQERTALLPLPVDKVLYMSSENCGGVKLIRSGQVRVFMMSDEGAEINLYRLVEGDICILSMAATECSAALDACVQAEREALVYMIPKNIYQKLSKENEAVRNFTQMMMTRRLGDIMNMARNVAFTSVSKRLADVLIYHMKLCNSNSISVTHDGLAKDIGSSREVVTRTLKQFQEKGMVAVERGKVIIVNVELLEAM